MASQGNVTPHLLKAVFDGQERIVRDLLYKNANPNIATKDGVTPLHLTAFRGFDKISIILLRHNAFVDAKDKRGKTPLHRACERGFKKVVRVLLDNNADVNSLDSYKQTPIYSAILNDDTELIEMLAKKRADVEVLDGSYFTPLMTAAMFGRINSIRCLLQKRADINRVYESGTPLFCAIRSVKYERPRVNDFHHITPDDEKLRIALEMVGLLIDHGADVNCENGQPMTQAVVLKCKEMIKLLIEKGADVNGRGGAAVAIAIDRGFPDILEYLLECCANTKNEFMKYNGTLLHMAAQKGDAEIVEILLRYGVDPNVEDDFGMSPLDMALEYGHKDAALLILKKGGGKNRKTTDYLMRNSPIANVEYHRQGPVFLTEVQNNRVSALKHAIASGVFNDVNFRDAGSGQTALIVAAMKGFEEMTSLLLSSGADPNISDDAGMTPLHIAAGGISFKLVANLMAHGAEFDAKANGKSCKEFAKELRISQLFVLIHRIFEGAKLNRKEIIDDIYGLNDTETIEAIFGVRSQGSGTLIEIAEKCKFEKFVGLQRWYRSGSAIPVLRDALILVDEGLRDEAVQILEKARSERAKTHSPQDTGLLSLDVLKCDLLCITRNFPVILAPLQNLYKAQLKVYGPNDRDVLRTQSLLGHAYLALGRSDEAREVLQQVIDKQKGKLIMEVNDEFVIDAMVGLEHLNIKMPEYDEQTKILLETILEFFERNPHSKLYSPSEVVSYKKSLALVLFRLSRTEEARQLLAQANEEEERLRPVSDALKGLKDTLGSTDFGVLELEREMWQSLKSKPKKATPAKPRVNTNIISAVTARNISDVVRFAKYGHVNYTDNDGRTALHYATDLGELTMVEELLKNGADVTKVSKKGNTVLHTAASKLHPQIVDVLLKNVCPKRMQDFLNVPTVGTGSTALHVAAKAGSLPIIRSLLKHGAVYDAMTHEGKRPIDLADKDTQKLLSFLEAVYEDVKLGQMRVFEKLFLVESEEIDVFLNAKFGMTGMTVVDISKAHGFSLMTTKLLDLQRLRRFPYEFEQILQDIKARKLTEIEKSMQKNCEVVFAQDMEGRSLLHHAAFLGDLEIVQDLVDNGALIDHLTYKGNTALHAAVLQGHKEIANFLLENIAQNKKSQFVNARTASTGTTALHIAAKNGLLDMVKLLLRHSAIFNVVDKAGRTPLEVSQDERVGCFLEMTDYIFRGAEVGDFEIVETLKVLSIDDLKAVGRCCTYKGSRGVSLIEIAMLKGYKRLAVHIWHVVREPLGCYSSVTHIKNNY